MNNPYNTQNNQNNIQYTINNSNEYKNMQINGMTERN